MCTMIEDNITVKMVFPENLPILRKDITDIEWTKTKAFLVTFMSIINIFMLFGNILSIVTICYTAKLRHKVSYWFVMNLAVIDLIISLTVVPLNTVWEYYGTWPLSRTACEFFTFADISFSTISAYSIVLVSIDKYLYITYSLHYYEKMTRKLALGLILAVWIMVLIFATVTILTEIGTDSVFQDHFLELPNNTNICIFVMTDTFVLPSAIFSFFVPFLILCFTSSRIVCIAVRHIKKIHSIQTVLISDTESEIFKALEKTKRMNAAKDKSNTTPRRKRKRGIFSIFHDKGEYTLDNQISPLTPPTGNVASVVPYNEEQGKSPHDHLNQSSVTLNAIKTNETHEIHVNGYNVTNSNTETHGDMYDDKEAMELQTKFPDSHGTVDEDNNHMHQLDDQFRPTRHSVHETIAENIEVDFNSRDSGTEMPLNSNINNVNKLRSESVLSTRRSNSIRSTQTSGRKTSPYCKLFGTVTIVIACFIIMFAPYNIATVIDIPCHCIEPWVYEDVLAVLYYMHSLVNPYIYMATDRNYRTALKSLYKRIKSKLFSSQSNNS